MERIQVQKSTYVTPKCQVIQLENENFICVSGRPNASGSSVQTNYDDKGTTEAGSLLFGDQTTIAPSKGGWFEEEDVLDN